MATVPLGVFPASKFLAALLNFKFQIHYELFSWFEISFYIPQVCGRARTRDLLYWNENLEYITRASIFSIIHKICLKFAKNPSSLWSRLIIKIGNRFADRCQDSCSETYLWGSAWLGCRGAEANGRRGIFKNFLTTSESCIILPNFPMNLKIVNFSRVWM